MDKHGIEQHFVRPDRVYATSVWTPIVGYQPVSDAMQVAARFVSGPGLAGPGFLQRWRWRRQAARNGFMGLGGALGFVGGVLDWVRNLVAGLRARLQAFKIERDLRKGAKDGTTVVSLDTSPRPTAAAQIVNAVRGLLPMPSATTPGAAAVAVQNQMTVAAAAPTVPKTAAAMAVGPGAFDMSTHLSNLWRQGY